MDKSLFFLIGGILLLALSWYLRRRNAQVLAAAAPAMAQQAGAPAIAADLPEAPESTHNS
jgi:LPXTG-motif cell wall-anchored protein